MDISRYKDHIQKHPVMLITFGNKNKIYKLPCSTTCHVSSHTFIIDLAFNYTFKSFFTLMHNFTFGFTFVYIIDLTFNYTFKSYFPLICNFTFVFTFVFTVDLIFNYTFKFYFTLICNFLFGFTNVFTVDLKFNYTFEPSQSLICNFKFFYVVTHSIWNSITDSIPISLQ